MPCRIKCWSLPNVPEGGRVDGAYLVACDHDGANGRGRIIFAVDPKEAKVFGNTFEAFEFVMKPSKTQPLRDNGQPNRPLRAYHTFFEIYNESSDDGRQSG